MTSQLFETLLETGEYTLGRPGKSYYLKFTYFIEHGQIIIFVDPHHPDYEYAINTLSKILIKKFRMIHGRHFIKSADNKNIVLTHTGYTLLKNQSKNNSELAYALELVELLFSLLKKYTKTEDDLREVEKILKNLLIDPNPLFKIERNQKYYYINLTDKIKEPLAGQIRTALINTVDNFRNNTPIKKEYIEFGIKECVNLSNKKFIMTPVTLIEKIEKYINNEHKSLYSPRSQNLFIHHDSPRISQFDYKAAHAAFDRIIVGNDLEGLKSTFDEYAQLITSQPTTKEQHAYKIIAFKYILNIFKKIESIEELSKLFLYLLSLKLKIDIHRNSIDSLFNIRNTNSWQELLGEIRDDAFSKLKDIVDDSQIKVDQTPTIKLLEKCLHMKLFIKPRSNWVKLYPTRAEQDIYVMLSRINNTNNRSRSNSNIFNS